MTKANTMVVAKMAAAVAAIGLVVSAFAFTANAQSASACASFNRDLTVGASGADVTALQNWLIGKGFTIAAGATGYFGGQTQAALARYQASVSISPAAGYFGPITRAKVGADCGNGGNTDDDDDDDNGSDDDGELEGGEADLRAYDFNDEEDSGSEGEEMVEIATAEFDVEDGDVRVERVEVVASSTLGTNASTRPWDYFDTLYLLDEEGDEIADVDASDRDEWDEGADDVWTIVFSGVDHIFNADETAELTLAGDIASNLDSDDITNGEFEFYIEDEGIRARDGEGIDHYIGDEDQTVTFGFDEEESGDVDINSSAEDPDSMTLVSDEDDESDEYTVFAFDLENNDDVDVLLTEIVIDVDNSSTTQAIDDLIDEATLVVDGEEVDGDLSSAAGDGTITFEDIDVIISGDDEIAVELIITLKEGADEAGLTFSVTDTNVEAESDDTGEESDVNGSATSETHTISLDAGITVDGVSTDADANDDNTVGTFTITFEVTAEGDEDIYIFNGANDFAFASTSGVLYNIYRSGTNLGAATTSDSALVQSDARLLSSGYYIVESGETEEFTLTVTIDPPSTGTSALYYVELDAVRFDTENDGLTSDDTTFSVPDDREFETNAVSLVS